MGRLAHCLTPQCPASGTIECLSFFITEDTMDFQILQELLVLLMMNPKEWVHSVKNCSYLLSFLVTVDCPDFSRSTLRGFLRKWVHVLIHC